MEFEFEESWQSATNTTRFLMRRAWDALTCREIEAVLLSEMGTKPKG